MTKHEFYQQHYLTTEVSEFLNLYESTFDRPISKFAAWAQAERYGLSKATRKAEMLAWLLENKPDPDAFFEQFGVAYDKEKLLEMKRNKVKHERKLKK